MTSATSSTDSPSPDDAQPPSSTSVNALRPTWRLSPLSGVASTDLPLSTEDLELIHDGLQGLLQNDLLEDERRNDVVLLLRRLPKAA